ncbi:hypothetical protein RIF29_41345 [Crotalaria pallida]|uniref:Dof zinc finger protein n=1 Tax=Crotalaria pallida TaxID=3830 RepID=A0AAN9E743_CROPI
MEQGGEGRVGGGDETRVVEMQQGGGVHVHQPQRPIQQPPRQCPRCGSMNTKFCYYNNYSLTQPRHYCKTCKRYWTQGGALRNIPIGGTRRRGGKHVVNNSSSFPRSPQPTHQGVVVHQPNMITTVKTSTTTTTNPSLAAVAPNSFIGSFHKGGGVSGLYSSSLPMIHSMNRSQSHLFNQSIKVGSSSSSNLGLVSGGIGVGNVGSIVASHQRHNVQQSMYLPQQQDI